MGFLSIAQGREQMKAMILAAGRGRRLAPLTDRLPKPLIEVGGTTLIERHLSRLAAAGIRDVVINVAHQGDLIEAHLGRGHALGVSIVYSREPDGPLETGGGIARALPLLGSAPFLVVNGDIWTDCRLPSVLPPNAQAHLVLVPNPPHHPAGDFDIEDGRVTRAARTRYTYAGIGIYTPGPFAPPSEMRFPLAPLLFKLCDAGALSAEIHRGLWFDIGTLERLQMARAVVAGN